MDPYRTLNVAAGRWNFAIGQQIHLPADEAELLIAAGAVRLIDAGPIVAQNPKRKTKKAEADGPDSDNAT